MKVCAKNKSAIKSKYTDRRVRTITLLTAKNGEIMNIKGFFEIAIKVKNLEASSKLYLETLGFKHGLLDDRRRWYFLWINGREGMIVLQEDKENWQQQHFSFSVPTWHSHCNSQI